MAINQINYTNKTDLFDETFVGNEMTALRF